MDFHALPLGKRTITYDYHFKLSLIVAEEACSLYLELLLRLDSRRRSFSEESGSVLWENQ
jgi:hypothetical protein